jgi:hypothetical protein
MLLVIIGTALVLVIAQLVVFVQLREHRIDLRPEQSAFEGYSRVWQGNVLRSKNYTTRGRRWLRWFVTLQVALGLLVLYLVVEFVLGS